ncbi:MAG: cob(I)yrinic acid a,c-diamide adenosyltransferase [Pseudomonadota bacterium]|nr:cob(I)yrinic acid a,c-diamide adenosyltransferase [Pseudomonadota bacterium]
MLFKSKQQHQPHRETMKSREKRRGIVLVNTGQGKGKSSAALGVVFRAAGWGGMKVCVIQYIKGKWKTGEQQAAERFDNIEWHALGDGFTWDTENPERDIQTSREIWQFSKRKILSEAYDLVLLDEINYCCGYGWISGEEIAQLIKQKPPWMHLILTGRNAAPEVIEAADTVTEMKQVKHAFEKDILAEQGMEF